MKPHVQDCHLGAPLTLEGLVGANRFETKLMVTGGAGDAVAAVEHEHGEGRGEEGQSEGGAARSERWLLRSMWRISTNLQKLDLFQVGGEQRTFRGDLGDHLCNWDNI